jgi:hypothetical protein
VQGDVTAYSSDITANTYDVAAINSNVTANNCDVKATTSPAGAAVANSSFLWAGRSTPLVADETTIKCRGKPDGGATVATAETPGGDFLQHSLSRLIRWGKRIEKEEEKNLRGNRKLRQISVEDSFLWGKGQRHGPINYKDTKP